MQSAFRVSASCLAVSAASLAAGAPDAAAAPKPISGTLSKSGYTVIAFAANGKATSVRAPRGRFRLVPPAKSVTLHLRAPDGTYAGPVVVGRSRSRAIVGVRAGARLGRILVHRTHAKPARRLPNTLLDAARTARARNGVPIGAQNFGRVRSRHSRGGVPGDFDLDGIPDRLDIDDDGDLVLDDLDRSSAARAAQTESAFHVFSDLSLGLEYTVNHDAGSSDAEIDGALPTFGILQIIILPGDSAELDCGGANQTPPRPEGLIYCRPHSSGGIGAIGGNCQSCLFATTPVLFPDCCDPDGDGFGRLTPLGPPAPGAGPVGGMGITPNATTAQIGTGDVLIQWIATGVPASQCPPPSASCTSFPSTLQFVFATVPALRSFSDGRGPPVTVSYPVAKAEPGREIEHPGGPGTQSNPFPVKADPSTGDVTLTLTFWRPQRRPTPGEPGYSDPPTAWRDIGGLAYTAAVGGGRCPQSAFSEATPRDPNLTPATPDSAPKVFNGGRGGFLDQARDQPASSANTFTYRLNLTRCLAASGLSFNSGEARGLDFQGITPNFGGVASQNVFFKRQ